MGISISVHNNSEYDPVKGEIVMLGGGKLPSGWSFELSPGEHFMNTDNGVSASCVYNLVLYIPNYDNKGVMKKISQRIKAPATRGNLNLYVSDVILDYKKKAIEALHKLSKTRKSRPHRRQRSQSPARRSLLSFRSGMSSKDAKGDNQRPRRASVDDSDDVNHEIENENEDDEDRPPPKKTFPGILGILINGKAPLKSAEWGRLQNIDQNPLTPSGSAAEDIGSGTPPLESPARSFAHNSTLRTPTESNMSIAKEALSQSEDESKGREDLATMRTKRQKSYSEILNQRRETLRRERESIPNWILNDIILWTEKRKHVAFLNIGILLLIAGCMARWLMAGGIGLAVSACLCGILLGIFHPFLLGRFLTYILRYTALNGFPMDFGAVHLLPSVWNGKLSISILAEEIGFGNPPGFPHEYFVTCKKLSFRASVRLYELFNLVRWAQVPWSPFPSVCHSELKKYKDGIIAFNVEGINLLPPGYPKSGKCYMKVKVGETSYTKTSVRKLKGKQARCSFGRIEIPYGMDKQTYRGVELDVKHYERVTLTVWERPQGGGPKQFLGEVGLTLEELKNSGESARGTCYPLLDKKGAIFSEAWAHTKHGEPTGRGSLVLGLSADLGDVKIRHWGPYETLDFLRPFCIVYDNGKEIARTEQVFAAEEPRWKDLSIKISELSADSVLKFEVWTYDDGPDGNCLLGCSKVPLAELASFKHTTTLPLNASDSDKSVKPGRKVKHKGPSITTSAFHSLPTDSTDESSKSIRPGFLKIKAKKKGSFRLPVPQWDQENGCFSRLRISRVAASELARKPAFLGVVDFEHIEFDTVMLNFETHRGEFNVNGVTRLIAEGEMARAVQQKISPPFMWPNCLKVRIIRARELKPKSGRVVSPKVLLGLRSQKSSTLAHQQNQAPIFDETFQFVATDPSAVLHIAVQNLGLMGKSFVGHWVMTLKWLYVNPRFCMHNNAIKCWDTESGLEPGTIRGWFPLLDWEMKRNGQQTGEIEMEISWVYEEGFGKDWRPPRARALEQLTANSNETKLRLGDFNAVQEMLDRFPLLVTVGRVTIRNVAFYLKDLFLGYKGAMEKKGVKEEALYVDFLESTKHLNVKNYQVGHTVNTFMTAWVKSLIPQVVKKVGLVGSATSQIVGSLLTSSFDFGGGSKRGTKNPGLLGIGRNTKKPSMIARFTKKIAVKLGNKKVWQKHLVTAHDTDYFLPVTVKGIIEKRTSRMKKWVRADMELKGCTLFYADVDKSGKKLHPDKKLDLSQATSIKLLSHNHKEIHIVSQHRNRWIRVPVDIHGPSIKEWYQKIKSHQRRNLKGVVRISLLNTNALDPHTSGNIHVMASIIKKGGERDQDIKQARSKAARVHGHSAKWKDLELLYVGPLVENSKALLLDLYGAHSVVPHIHHSHHKPIASIKIPLTAITKEEQDFSLPWKPLDPKRMFKKLPVAAGTTDATLSSAAERSTASIDSKEDPSEATARKKTESMLSPSSAKRKTKGKGLGILTFKAQLHSSVVMYRETIYADPDAVEEGDDEKEPTIHVNGKTVMLPTNRTKSLGSSKKLRSVDVSDDTLPTTRSMSPKFEGRHPSPKKNGEDPLQVIDWQSHDLELLASRLKAGGSELRPRTSSLRSADDDEVAENKRLHDTASDLIRGAPLKDSFMPIHTEAETTTQGTSAMTVNTQGPSAKSFLNGETLSRSAANPLQTKVTIKSDSDTDFSSQGGLETRSGGLHMDTKIAPTVIPEESETAANIEYSRSGTRPSIRFSPSGSLSRRSSIPGGMLVGPEGIEQEARSSIVFKYGHMGKSKRELRLGKLHLYISKLGSGKAKHGKIPYNNVVEVSLLPKKGGSHFMIKFAGSVMSGSRHFEASSEEEAIVLVETMNILVKQAKAMNEIYGKDPVSPPRVVDTPAKD